MDLTEEGNNQSLAIAVVWTGRAEEKSATKNQGTNTYHEATAAARRPNVAPF